MQLVINGESQSFPQALTVAELLEQLSARGPHVAVEVNKQLIPRGEHLECKLQDGDQVEVVTLVGGG